MHIHQPLKSASMRRCSSLLRESSSASGYLEKSWSYSVFGALVHMKLARSTTSPITCRWLGSCRLSICPPMSVGFLANRLSASARRIESGSMRMSSSMNRICSQSVFFSASYITRL